MFTKSLESFQNGIFITYNLFMVTLASLKGPGNEAIVDTSTSQGQFSFLFHKINVTKEGKQEFQRVREWREE